MSRQAHSVFVAMTERFYVRPLLHVADGAQRWEVVDQTTGRAYFAHYYYAEDKAQRVADLYNENLK